MFADRFRSPLQDRVGPRFGGFPGRGPSPFGPRFGTPFPVPPPRVAVPATVEVATYPPRVDPLSPRSWTRGRAQIIKEYRLQTEAGPARSPGWR